MATAWAKASEVPVAVRGHDLSIACTHDLNALVVGQVDALSLHGRDLLAAYGVDCRPADMGDAPVLQRCLNTGFRYPPFAHSLQRVSRYSRAM